MLRIRNIIILIVLIVVGVVVYRLPARWISDRVVVPGVDIDGVAGTLWNGQVTRLTVNDNPVAPLRWTLHPGALLGGRLAADVEMFPKGGRIRGTVAAGRDEQIEATDVVVEGPLQHIAGGTSLGPILGTIDARFERIELTGSELLSAVGEARVDNFQYPANAPYGLGSFVLVCDDTDGPPVGCVLNDTGDGPLEVDAEVTLGPDKAYALRGRVRARPDAPNELRQGLMFVGPSDSVGNHTLDFSGRLD